MNNVTKNRLGQNNYRHTLLATASAMVLAIALPGGAQAADPGSDRPVLWIEGGWHFEQVLGKDETFDPGLADALASAGLVSPLKRENHLAFSYGADGAITYQPENSEWLFSASIRYGRAQGHKHSHTEIPNAPVTIQPFGSPAPVQTTPPIRKFSDVAAPMDESHLITDFSAGRDVGLGLANSTSTLSLGVRFAQFHSRSTINISGDPTAHVNVKYIHFGHIHALLPIPYYQIDRAFEQNERTFTGLGPSLSWKASAPVAGNLADGELAFDWGLNAAALFGRQKAKVLHQTRMQYHAFRTISTVYNSPPPQDRTRRIIVPNLGGFAGVSFRYGDAKVSLGYRADFFFNAIDGGIDARKEETRGFYGPFASISIGLGD